MANTDPNVPVVSAVSAQPTIEAPIMSQTPAQVAPLTPPPLPLTPTGQVYSLADIEKVREQEKAKLYDKQRKLEEENARLRLSNPPAQDDRISAELAELRASTAASNQLLQDLTAQNAAEKLNRRVAELTLFMNERIAAYREAGYGLITEMITGSNEQEIEASVQASANAYLAYFRNVPSSAPQQVPTAIVVSARPAPQQGFPTAPNSPGVIDQSANQPAFMQQVQNLTTPEAVRSGEYGKNRKQIMAALQNQGGGMGGTLSNQPRFAPAPGQGPQSTFSNVQQPQGLPTPQVVHPNQAPYAQQYPQQPVYQQAPPQYAPQQPQQWQPPQQMQYAPQPQPMYAPPYQQQPQYQQPPSGQAFTPEQINQGAPFDPAAARARAEQTATRHLAQPDAAKGVQGLQSSGLQQHREYQGVANGAVQFVPGVNPMVRNN